MNFPDLHSFDLTPKEAVRLQNELRVRLVDAPPPRRPRLVAGSDCAFSRAAAEVVAVVVVFAWPGLVEVERRVGRAPLRFPYVPGLLTFREAPAILDAFRQVENAPDVVLFDGQGRAHPRRIGLAAHLGLWLDRPTIGCAKSRLVGESRGDPGPRRGNRRLLVDRGEPVGVVLRTREGAKPIFVSPGHRCDLAGAARIALAAARGRRVPEPTRIADHAVAALVREVTGPAGAWRIRSATPADLPAVAEVRTASWRAAYAGLVSAERLAALDSAETARRWAKFFPEMDLRVAVASGEVIGFAEAGPCRDEDLRTGDGEVRALYLHPKAWDRGIGRALLADALDRLVAKGFAAATLWVLAGNARGRRFYERAAFRPDGGEKPWPPEGLSELRLRRPLRRPSRSRPTAPRRAESRPPPRPAR